MNITDFIISNFNEFLTYTGFANATVGNLIMIVVGIFFIWLAIKKDFEPLLLVPIGLGIVLGNIPFRADAGLEIGLYEDNSVLNIFYQGVRQGWYPPLVFLGIGAMTDFSALISNPTKYSGGSEILKEVYTLKDQGDRTLGLRYDLTVPFSKVISMNAGKTINLPFKRYEVGKVFRDGPVKTGRAREFYQCDVDVCGLEGSFIEAEMLMMTVECYKKLGIDIYVEINNRKLLEGFIISSGIDKELTSKVILS